MIAPGLSVKSRLHCNGVYVTQVECYSKLGMCELHYRPSLSATSDTPDICQTSEFYLPCPKCFVEPDIRIQVRFGHLCGSTTIVMYATCTNTTNCLVLTYFCLFSELFCKLFLCHCSVHLDSCLKLWWKKPCSVLAFTFTLVTTLTLVGTMSATRTSTMVNIKTETCAGSLEVLQKSQMRNEAVASQSSSHIQSSLAGVLCPFFSFLKQICSFFDIVFCPHLGRFENYSCMENYKRIFTLMARTFLWWNTYISVGDSIPLIELTAHLLMIYMCCEHCVFNVLSKYCFVTE
jgi:hypothetical protein